MRSFLFSSIFSFFSYALWCLKLKKKEEETKKEYIISPRGISISSYSFFNFFFYFIIHLYKILMLENVSLRNYNRFYENLVVILFKKDKKMSSLKEFLSSYIYLYFLFLIFFLSIYLKF